VLRVVSAENLRSTQERYQGEGERHTVRLGGSAWESIAVAGWLVQALGRRGVRLCVSLARLAAR
jgi:hypothetical protein